MYIATERLYVNRDYSKVVPESSPEAAFLLATPGKAIPEALARRLGLLNRPPGQNPPATPALDGLIDEAIETIEAAPTRPRRRAHA